MDAAHIVVRTTFGLMQSFDGGATWSWICEAAASANGFQDPEIIVTTGGRIAMGLPDGLAIGEQRGCQNGQHGVLGAGNPDIAVERLAAGDYDLCH